MTNIGDSVLKRLIWLKSILIFVLVFLNMINQVRSLSETETEGALFKMPLRFKDVQVVNMDNM